MENKIAIFHYDDEEDDLKLIPNCLTYVANDLGVVTTYKTAKTFSESIEHLTGGDFDLIILDMIDIKGSNKEVGVQLLDFLFDSGKTIPVIIYTSRNPREADYSTSVKYTYIEKFLQKRIGKEEIRKVFSEFLERKGHIPQIYTFDQDNYDLKAEINTIGLNEINTFLVRIKKYLRLEKPNFKIYKITSGLSGAIIFRVEYAINGNVKSFLLKISKDKDAIRKELNNTEYYRNLPPQFRLEYNPTISKTDLESDHFAAILIEYAENATTLFDWLTQSDVRGDKVKIETLFIDLFLSSGLKGFYDTNKSNDKKKYNFIFNKFDERRISFIKRAINELKPIIERVQLKWFDQDLIDQLLFTHIYKNINYKQGNPGIEDKNLILSHGDFHAKNILISAATRPSIIDTGGFDYDYWSTDIARLIVNLFMEGFDLGTYSFFSTSSQLARIDLAEQIIRGIPLEIPKADAYNNGFIHAINWLRKNIVDIYPDYFIEWEFQLNLGLEFFKSSYKSITLPPGKRVLALMAACACVTCATESLNGPIKK